MGEFFDMRKDYSLASLDGTTANKDPLLQFKKWFDDAVAAQIPEPNAMNLATLSKDGRPSSRIVLLKGIESGGFLFFTNYQSQKGIHLEEHPACALNFFWPELERQVRIEGTAEKISAEASDTYFKGRPRASQVSAWSSPQSAIIIDRTILEERVKEMEKKFKDQPVLPRPHQWGGYLVTPLIIEFWQGRPNRLHDRIGYTRADSEWKILRLAP